MEFLPIFLICFFLFIAELIFLIQGAPFVKSTDEFEKQIIKEIQTYKPKKILELGSGDGKLVFALAERGYNVTGVELNPVLVKRSIKVIKERKLQKQANIIWKNFWSYNTCEYDLVVVYGIKHIMGRLEKKLLTELPKGAIIISNYFIFPNLKPIKIKGRMNVYRTTKN